MGLTSAIKNILKKLVASTGYEIHAIGSRGLGYISATDIIQKARSNNQTVNQYLEDLWGLDTHASSIIQQFELDRLKDENALQIVEIGAGTGVYLNKVMAKLGQDLITRYQVYETAADWVQYLKITYNVDLPSANGYQLNSTTSDSVDFVHAHGVFVYTSFITSMSYLREMIRVAKKGGILAFDVFDESSYNAEIITKWIDSGHTYPNIFPEKMVHELFPASEFKLLKTFHAAFDPGRSRYYVYEKL